MKPTREMKKQFTPEELEELSTQEEAYLTEMNKPWNPTREMKEQFTPEELEELSLKETDYYIDRQLEARERTKEVLNNRNKKNKKSSIEVGRPTPVSTEVKKNTSTVSSDKEISGVAEDAIRRRRANTFENRNLPLGELSASEKRLSEAVKRGIKPNLPLYYDETPNSDPMLLGKDIVDNPKDIIYDSDYFDSLIDHGEYIDAGGSIPKDVFEILETADNTAIKAAVSSNKKVAVEGAEEAAIKVAKTVFESSRADKALSNLVSKAGRFNKAGPEALRLGALATTLGLGAGYAAGRRRKKR